MIEIEQILSRNIQWLLEVVPMVAAVLVLTTVVVVVVVVLMVY